MTMSMHGSSNGEEIIDYLELKWPILAEIVMILGARYCNVSGWLDAQSNYVCD